MSFWLWHWAVPVAAWLLPGAALPWLYQTWRERRQTGLAFTQVRMARGATRQLHQYGRWVAPSLQTLAWVFLVGALARPWIPGSNPAMPQGRAVDILLALDVSRSMRADDIAPSRLDAAKSFLKKFIQQHPEARMGLLVFAGRSLLRVPLTTDHELVLESLAEANVSSAVGEGTSLGDALRLSAERLMAAVSAPESTENPPLRLAVVLTDGVNHTGADPVEAVRGLSRRGIELCLVGVGRTQPTPRWEWDEAVEQRRPVLDVYGQPEFWETLDEKGLKQLIQNHGRGYFIRLDQPRTQDAVLGALRTWEAGAEQRHKPGHGVQELFWIPLLMALLCLSADFVLAKIWFRRLLST